MIQKYIFCLIERKTQPKYEPNQPSSASSFKPIRTYSESFFSNRRLLCEWFKVKKQNWITNMKYCCHLAINSSPMFEKQNVLFCYQRLPFHPSIVFISSPSSIVCFFVWLINSKQNVQFLTSYLGCWSSSHFGSPQACRDLKAFEGGAAHVAWSNWSSHKASILGP